ncbi:MAG: metallophosphoesterase family protein [Candidatus Helarchaeota archaeon]
MIILELIAISDIYSDIKIVQELISTLEKTEKKNRIIIVAGDIGLKARSRHYNRDVNQILSFLSSVCSYLFYISGEADKSNLEVEENIAQNLDKKNYILELGGVKIGLLGLGGAPKSSVRSDKSLVYLWDENIPVVADGLYSELKVNIEKVVQGHPDYIILVTHSPPYGIADYSTPITLREIITLESLLEEITDKKSIEEKKGSKKESRGPRHLGSKIIKKFVKYYKPDIHIFGHVHKEGGKIEIKNDVKFFNVSHLSPLPYKLTGRKVLHLKLSREKISSAFYHIVNADLIFHEFLETYV